MFYCFKPSEITTKCKNIKGWRISLWLLVPSTPELSHMWIVLYMFFTHIFCIFLAHIFWTCFHTPFLHMLFCFSNMLLHIFSTYVLHTFLTHIFQTHFLYTSSHTFLAYVFFKYFSYTFFTHVNSPCTFFTDMNAPFTHELSHMWIIPCILFTYMNVPSTCHLPPHINSPLHIFHTCECLLHIWASLTCEYPPACFSHVWMNLPHVSFSHM